LGDVLRLMTLLINSMYVTREWHRDWSYNDCLKEEAQSYKMHRP
jgi:hypothetical protein